jgi:predicted membrane channel-forming protein YqfA (hemolysin III family)
MDILIILFIIASIISYIGLIIMEPEKHVIGLIIIAIFAAIFGAFYETTGAKSDYDRKKRG